mmetsp:Transcript_22727/g.34374  ORF Transcript_22727/g.34374 Transcript_22727/m.34374 type:complete len:486 (+) Transcript_22727:35-1492(+)
MSFSFSSRIPLIFSPNSKYLAAFGACVRRQFQATSKESVPLYKVTKLSRRNGEISTKYLPTSEIMHDSSIYARDLFSLQLTSKQERKTKRQIKTPRTAILPRGKQILLNFGAIRAVVGTDEVWLFDAHTVAVKEFALELQNILETEWKKHENNEEHLNVPFELIILEAVLRDTTNIFQRRLYLYEPILSRALDSVSKDIFSDGMIRIAPLQESLQAFELRVRKSLRCISDLLNNDEDMLGLLITEQHSAEKSGKIVEYAEHEKVELLLEEYGRRLNDVLYEINFLLTRLHSTQEFLQLAMSSFRNRMIRMELYIGITGLSLGIGTAVAGFFGMNLLSGIEEHPAAFYLVLGGTSLTSLVVAGSCIQFISTKSLQRDAEKHLEEIETLGNALSDMNALDVTIKNALRNSNCTMSKEEFGKALKRYHALDKIKQAEIDLLFDSLDQDKNGTLFLDDFPAYSNELIKEQDQVMLLETEEASTRSQPLE